MALRSRSVLVETHRSVKDSEAFLRLAVEGYERGLERGDGLDEDAGVAVDDAGHQRAELRTLRHPGQVA
jgi:hypothetical protein